MIILGLLLLVIGGILALAGHSRAGEVTAAAGLFVLISGAARKSKVSKKP